MMLSRIACVKASHAKCSSSALGRSLAPIVLETVLGVTMRRTDDDGVELSSEDSKADYLARLDRGQRRRRCGYVPLTRFTTRIPFFPIFAGQWIRIQYGRGSRGDEQEQ